MRASPSAADLQTIVLGRPHLRGKVAPDFIPEAGRQVQHKMEPSKSRSFWRVYNADTLKSLLDASPPHLETERGTKLLGPRFGRDEFVVSYLHVRLARLRRLWPALPPSVSRAVCVSPFDCIACARPRAKSCAFCASHRRRRRFHTCPSLMLSSCAGTSGCKMCRARGRPLPRFVSRSDLAAAGALQPRILARLGKLAVSLAQHPTELRVPPVVNRW
jgi:hypothetical protein